MPDRRMPMSSPRPEQHSNTDQVQPVNSLGTDPGVSRTVNMNDRGTPRHTNDLCPLRITAAGII